jgi:hypothetical protein
MAVTFNPKFQTTPENAGLQFTVTLYDSGMTQVAGRPSSINYPKPGWDDEMIKSFKLTLPYMAEEMRKRTK